MTTDSRVRRAFAGTATSILCATLICTWGWRTPAALADQPAFGAPAAYRPVGPVRLADTRDPTCGCSRVDDHTIRVAVTDRDDVPDDAIAAAVTLTALTTPTPGYVTAYPGGSTRPETSSLNTRPDRVVANSAVIPLGAGGTIDVYTFVDGISAGQVVVDLTGVFIPASESAAGRFVAAAPRRVFDSRSGAALAPDGSVTVPLPDGVADDATALVVNVTSVDGNRPGYVEARPGGSTGAPTSFLNLNGSGQPVAAGTIQPVSSSGLTLTTSAGGHLIVDLLGWFTGPSAASATDGLYVALTPTRFLDTRLTGPRLAADGTIQLAAPVTEHPAASFVTNLTVVDPDWRGFVTAYAAGTPRPETSTANAIEHDHTVANLAVTPASDQGLAYFSLAGTDLVVDATGYFTGAPAAATEPVPPNDERTPRVLVIGDSAMAGLDVYTDARRAYRDFEVVLDAANCRRLVYASCLSPATHLVPNTALDALTNAGGPFDIVYIDAGHNDWHDPDFAWQFDLIVQAARRLGAAQILWATYTENVRSAKASLAYVENNANLRFLTSLPQYPDVALADWNAYATPHPEWFYDGTHMRTGGAWAQADYLARWFAAITHRPCPKGWLPGEPAPDPCPHPDAVGAPQNPQYLY